MLVLAASSIIHVITGQLGVTISQRSPLRVRVGERVSFECQGEGSPTPNVYWEYPARRPPLPGGGIDTSVRNAFIHYRVKSGVILIVAVDSLPVLKEHPMKNVVNSHTRPIVCYLLPEKINATLKNFLTLLLTFSGHSCC